MKKWLTSVRVEAQNYLRHLAGMLLPGVKVTVPIVHTTKPLTLEKWEDAGLQSVIDEGRRQLDRQSARFDRVRTSAQLLFTTALGLLVVMAASAHRVLMRDYALVIAWVFGLVVVAIGVLGAAALLTVQSEFGAIDTALLTYSGPNPLRPLAEAYSQQVRTGEDTVAARVTVYRDAVWLVLLGASVQLVVWLTTIS